VAELLADEDARMRMEAAKVYSYLAEPREAIPVLRPRWPTKRTAP